MGSLYISNCCQLWQVELWMSQFVEQFLCVSGTFLDCVFQLSVALSAVHEDYFIVNSVRRFLMSQSCYNYREACVS